MAADDPSQPDRPDRSGAVLATRDLLGRDELRAFEAYFAAEQANLESLARSAAERSDPDVTAFHQAMASVQRGSLAQLSYRIASMLPEVPARPAASPALASILTQNRTSRARALATSISARPRTTGGVLSGIAAAAVIAFTLLATREPTITAHTPIAPRVAEASTATPTPTSTPTPTPTPEPEPTPQPGVLERARMVTVYGHPNEPITGLLGKHPPGGAALEAVRLAREWEETDGRPTVGALHVTVHVAQAQQTADGTYLERLDAEGMQLWVDAAREHDVLLILDTQIGWSDALTESKLLEPWLRLPFVHLALDPEFATGGLRVAPGRAIGTLHSSEINDVQAYLGDLVRSEGLPRKMLMVHQFRGDMIGQPEGLVDDPDIEMVIDMDGFGDPGSKLLAYEQFALAPHVERPAIKLFFEWDEPLLTPAELSALDIPPDVIVYQ